MAFDGGEADDLNDSPLIDDKLFQAMESAMEVHQEGFESARGLSKFVLTLQLSLSFKNNVFKIWILTNQKIGCTCHCINYALKCWV